MPTTALASILRLPPNNSRPSFSAAPQNPATSQVSSPSSPTPHRSRIALLPFVQVATKPSAPSEHVLHPPPRLPHLIHPHAARHRQSASHACTPPPADPSAEPAPEKNAAAKALLAKHFVSSTAPTARVSSSASKPPVSAKKQAAQRQVALMKMRHQAQPGDLKDAKAVVPLDQRLHLKVSQVGSSDPARVFWFRKVLSPVPSP